MLTQSVSRHGAGVFEFVRGLSVGLHALPDVEVEVFGLEDRWTEEDRPRWEGVPVRAEPIAGLKAFGYSPELYQRIRDANLDVLHISTMWMYPSIVSSRWTAETGKPVVVSSCGFLDPWALGNSRWKKAIAAALYERKHLQRAACVHAACDLEARSVRGFGLENPIAVIANAADDPKKTGAPPPWEVGPAGEKVLLYLGRLHPKKNVAAMIEAWADACKQAPDAAQRWRLVIAGWDQLGYTQQCKEVAERTQAPRVTFVGAQHGLGKSGCFENASAFILPSLSEGLPIAIPEAFSYGLPVVMTPECNVPEGAAHGAAIEIGTSVPAIAEGLRQLFTMSDGELGRMGTASRALFDSTFNWTSVAGQMAQLYRWLLEGGPPRVRLYEGAAAQRIAAE